jgi:hypothetical protein
MPITGTTFVTVKGQYYLQSGSVAAGKITFRLSNFMQDATHNEIIAPITMSVDLNAAGYFEISLPATDDPDSNPTGTTYRVTEKITGSEDRQYDIILPHNVAELWLPDVVPVSTKPAFDFALNSILQQLYEEFQAHLVGHGGGGAIPGAGVIVETMFADASIPSRALQDEIVRTEHLGPEAVTGTKIAEGAVSPPDHISVGTIPLELLEEGVVVPADLNDVMRKEQAVMNDISGVTINPGEEGEIFTFTIFGLTLQPNDRLLVLEWNGTSYPARPPTTLAPRVAFSGPDEPTSARANGSGWLVGDYWYDEPA